MNTFLPYPDFVQSAACLDRQRLGKQRVEVLQLLKALLVSGSGWANHPATKMWRGHEMWLAIYGIAICEEWTNRGYRDTCRVKIADMVEHLSFGSKPPPWLGDEAFHLAHKSNLIRKMPEHYGELWPGVPVDLPYVWPV